MHVHVHTPSPSPSLSPSLPLTLPVFFFVCLSFSLSPLKLSDEEISEFLDDLRELGIGEQSQPDTPNTSLNQTGSQPSSTPSSDPNDKESDVPESVRKLSSEWVPLELCFGVPLFSDETNKSVCQKVSGSLSL